MKFEELSNMNIEHWYSFRFKFHILVFECPSHVKHFQMLINTQFTFKMLFVPRIFFLYIIRSMNEKSNWRQTKCTTPTIEGWILFSHWCWICHRYQRFSYKYFNFVTKSGAEHLWHKHVLRPTPSTIRLLLFYFYVLFFFHLSLLQNHEIDTFQFRSMNLIPFLVGFRFKSLHCFPSQVLIVRKEIRQL